MNSGSAFRRCVACATLASFLVGCYSQYPLGLSVPAPATRVTAEVTDTGTVVMGNAIGPGAIGLEGIVADANATTWKLYMLRVDQRGGISTVWNGELVTFPRNALTNVSEKRLDRKKSWAAAGLIAAAAILAARAFGAFSFLDEGSTTTPPAQ